MNFDLFMASFNTKKAEDADGEKAFLPRIFAYVHDDQYPISIGSIDWMTIVSDVDVAPAKGVEAYVVTKVRPDETRYKATLKEVKELKHGEPYLLHAPSGNYQMTKIPEGVDAPAKNLLEVSDKTTAGEVGNTSVYVLANKNNGVGFYRWTGGELGIGRVYLPVSQSDTPASGGGEAKAFDFCNFMIETAIDNVEKSESDAKQYYNLNGQRVAKPIQKGVYVVNGKIVVVK